MRKYNAIHIHAGEIRRILFEAVDESEAREICTHMGVGLEGPAEDGSAPGEPEPQGYPLKAAQRMLGGVSRATIYRELHLGRLDRMPDTRKVIITAESIRRRMKAGHPSTT